MRWTWLSVVAAIKEALRIALGDGQAAGESSEVCQFGGKTGAAGDVKVAAPLGVVVAAVCRDVDTQIEIVGGGEEGPPHVPVSLTESGQSLVRGKCGRKVLPGSWLGRIDEAVMLVPIVQREQGGLRPVRLQAGDEGEERKTEGGQRRQVLRREGDRQAVEGGRAAPPTPL